MLIAESGRVHLHGVVTRDVRLSSCLKKYKSVRKILDIQPIFTLRITNENLFDLSLRRSTKPTIRLLGGIPIYILYS